MDALLADPELRARWMRYHAIGDLMRDGELGADLVARVRTAIAAEPPLRSASNNVVPLVRHWRPTRPPSIGLALAASVAVATVVGLRALMPGGEPAVSEAAAVASGEVAIPEAASADHPRITPAGGAMDRLMVPVLSAETGPLAPERSADGASEGGDLPQARVADYLDRHQRRAATGLLADPPADDPALQSPP